MKPFRIVRLTVILGSYSFGNNAYGETMTREEAERTAQDMQGRVGPPSMNRPENNAKGKRLTKSDGNCEILSLVAVHQMTLSSFSCILSGSNKNYFSPM
jgi:hypothetical protein